MIPNTSLLWGDLRGRPMASFCWHLVRGFKTCNSRFHHPQIRLIFSTLFMDFSKHRSINLPSCCRASNRTPPASDLVHIFTSCLKRRMMIRCQLCWIFRTEWCSQCRRSTTFWCTIRKASCPLQWWKAFITTRSMTCRGWARPCSWRRQVMVFALLSSLIAMSSVKS